VGNMRDLPRFWIWMQIVIIVCVLISAVIVIIRL
jgi:ABC-type multidrug transport system permease subunit